MSSQVYVFGDSITVNSASSILLARFDNETVCDVTWAEVFYSIAAGCSEYFCGDFYRVNAGESYKSYSTFTCWCRYGGDCLFLRYFLAFHKAYYTWATLLSKRGVNGKH